MHVTLLGTGDTLGMPVPLCDCHPCTETEIRRRPGLRVELNDTTLVFDAGPDIREQLIRTETDSVDAFFLTHGHDDHIGGIPELHKLSAFNDTPIVAYAESPTWSHVLDTFPWIEIDQRTMSAGEHIQVGPLTVKAFRIEHSEQFPELGFAVTDGDSTVAYAPDVWALPETAVLQSVDVLFVDALYLLGKPFPEDDDHAGPARLQQEIDAVGADRVVLTNVSEHHHHVSTAEFKNQAGEYEVWSDFDSVSLSVN